MNLRRAYHQSVQNLVRNRVLSLATVAVIAIMVFIFNVLLAANFIAQRALDDLSQKVDFVVFLRDDVSVADVERMTGDLKKIVGVRSVEYTSKEQALHEITKYHPDTAAFFKKYRVGNPLPASVRIITVEPEVHREVQRLLDATYPHLLSTTVTKSGQSDVVTQDVVKQLTQLKTFTNQTIFWMLLVYILASSLILMNAVHLTVYTRKMEFTIMRLVGATPAAVRLPLVLEGLWYGLLGVLLGTIVLVVVGNAIRIHGTTLFSYYTTGAFIGIFLMELLVTLAVSALASFIAAEKHAKD